MYNPPSSYRWHNYIGLDSMKIYTTILGNIADVKWQERASEAKIEHITLDQWTAQKSRFIVRSDQEREYAVALKRNTRLKDGDILDYDAEQNHICIIRLSLRDVMEIDLGALMQAEPDDIIHTAVELGHALGNQHWPAVVKGCKVFVPLTVDRKVMDSVMKSHNIENLVYSFQSAAQIIPFLSPNEVRRLLGGSEPHPDTGHHHAHHEQI